MKLILPLIVTALGAHKAMGNGACCIDFGDPYCFETDAEDCALQGGVYYGDGSTCATDAPDCVPAYGACCFGGVECFETYEFDCFNSGGDFAGQNSTCADIPECDFVFGACCFNGTDCWETDQDDCWWSGGEFAGPNTTCADIPWCVEYYGSCCFGQFCEYPVSESNCEGSGGIFWFDPCELLDDVEECVANFGACCLGEQECLTDVPLNECNNMGGTYYGDDSTDCGNNCPELGACCIGFDCVVLSDWECLLSGGENWEPGSCFAGICGEPECPADLNGDGQVNFTDLASVLSGWNTSDAGDANGDRVTNFEDLQLILSFWGDC